MIPEIDIWRAAQVMLKRYGETAGLEAARRADERLEEGDTAGAALWRRILKAIENLQDTNPPRGDVDSLMIIPRPRLLCDEPLGSLDGRTLHLFRQPRR